MASYSYNSIKGRVSTIMVLMLLVFAASSIYVSIQSNRINRLHYLLSKHAEPTITLGFIANWKFTVQIVDIYESFLYGNDELFERNIKAMEQVPNFARTMQSHADTLDLGVLLDESRIAGYEKFRMFLIDEYALYKSIRGIHGLDSARNYFLSSQFDKIKGRFWEAHSLNQSAKFKDTKEALALKVTKLVNLFSTISIFLAVIGIVLVIIFWINIQRFITGTVQKISSVIFHLSQGRLVYDTETKYGEAGEILNSTNKLVDHLQSASTFAESIGKGDFSLHFEPTSADDTLGKSLLNMRNELKRFKMEDDQRNWVNIGIAELGEVIRKNNTGLETLCDAFLKAIVKYTEVNQGSIYLLDTASNERLKRMSTYAYGKKKFIEECVEVGEGLIGQTFLDKEYLLLTEIPNDYVKITSGLGESLPSCVLIVPCMNDQSCVGVLELASFTVIHSYQIDFVQKICNTFASVVYTAGNQERNLKLVEELTQKTEQMHSQEEELRQNMEELLATQEEMQHKTHVFKEFADIVNAFTIIIDLSHDGKILNVNEKFVSHTGYSKEEIVGQNHTYYVPPEAVLDGSFEALWNELSKGKNIIKDVLRMKKDGTRFWLRASYLPILDHEGKIKRITCLCFDITDEKLKLLELEKSVSV